MTLLQRYKPSPVYLPADGALSRRFYKNRSHLGGRRQLLQSDYQGYETHVIFNDLFIHCDGGCIQGIGPPLVNLREHLLPMELILDAVSTQSAKAVKPKISNYDRVSFFRFVLPAALRGATSLDVVLRFANGLEVRQNLVRQSLPGVALQFVTLQKNNPVEWILDWLRYLQHMGVERVLLYDNGSDNIEHLADALGTAELTLSVVLVDWPFPYGPLRSYYNQFCQATQNNHGYQCFGAADWVGHFDIDEYPLPMSGPDIPQGSLKRLLASCSARTGLLRFDSFWVPRLEGAVDGRLPTVRQFGFRMRESRGRAHKYLMRASAWRMANTHNGKVRLGYRRKALPIESWAFLHYKPLTTNWRDYVVRGSAEEYSKELHVGDSRIAAVFDKGDVFV